MDDHLATTRRPTKLLPAELVSSDDDLSESEWLGSSASVGLVGRRGGSMRVKGSSSEE